MNIPHEATPRGASTRTVRRPGRLVVPMLAAGLAALSLPLSNGAPAAAADGDVAFGYSAQVTASPVKLEIFEPTIPIPATPQAEFEFGYTKVVADSSSSRGRSSFFWPGDAVGEGAKTIVENLGLPPEISGPVGEQGYPVQVNSGYPSGPEGQANEPFPGSVMRTGATEKTTYAQSGYSTTCDTSGVDGDGTGDGGGGGGLPGLPGLPELPLPIPGLGGPAERSAPVSRSSSRAAAADDGAGTDCQVPAQLSALVSFANSESLSYTERTPTAINGVARAAAGDVTLLGGVIQISGVKSKVTSTSDGKTPTGKGKSSYGTLTLGGQEFTIGPDGVEGGGQTSPLPGLPDDPAKALEQLGVTITVPKPTFERDGKEILSTVEGLVVTIDSKTLSDALRSLPLQDLIAQLPDDFKDLKKALQAAVNLSPKFVLHLAYTQSKLETADPIVIPDAVPDNDPGGDDSGASGGSSVAGSGGVSGGTTAPAGTTPSAAGGDTATGDLPPAELASGLPPLFSIPGLLLVGGVAGAVVAGSYVRRMGALVLGGGAACSHGLDSGLPDLRKAQ